MKIEKLTAGYLVLPLGYLSKNKKIIIYADGKMVLEFDAPVDMLRPDYFKYLDLSALSGQKVEIITEPELDTPFSFTDRNPALPQYDEKYRPTAHFSAGLGWLSDPNGLVFYDGLYHLFFQHNPFAHTWSNMHWGHAVSRDLLHWKEREPALSPDELGTIFSGSAIVDRENRTGLKENEKDVLLLYYTAAGNTSKRSAGKPFTQCMAYSTDGGLTFTKYKNNPVIEHIEAENRDPKVVYVEEISAYVMALYLSDNRYTLLVSDDLLSWKFLQEISLPGDAECPDIYPLYLDEDRGKKRWVLSGAFDRFLIGEFRDGRFRPSGPPQQLHYGSNSYAAQTFSDIPETDGRRLRIAWNTTAVPQSCFGGSMCLPCEMRLQTIRQEEVVTAWPIAEISALFTERKTHLLEELSAGSNYLIDRLTPGAAWMEFWITPSEDGLFEWTVFGTGIEVNVPENIVRCMDKSMPLHLEDGQLHLLVIADTLGFEIFGGRGQSFMCMGFPADFNLNGLELRVHRGSLLKMECTLCGLENIWRSNDR